MAIVPRQHITQQKIAEHVQRLGELYPPIPLDSVDRTIKRPWLVARKFGHVIDYLARVELEVYAAQSVQRRLRDEQAQRVLDGAAPATASVSGTVRWSRSECEHAAARDDYCAHAGAVLHE